MTTTQLNKKTLDNKVIQGDSYKGNYWNWLKMQFTDLDRFAWLLYGIGMGFQFALYISQPLTLMSTIAFVAIGFGFLTTIMMAAKGWVKTKESNGSIKEHLVSGRSVNGLLGAISVIGYIIVNVSAGHWWSVIDQLIFFFAIDLAMIVKWRTWGNGDDEPTKDANFKDWLLIAFAILVGWGILEPVGVWLGDTQPVVDSLVLAFGAVASILYVKRNSASYLVFMGANVINIILWVGAMQKGLSPEAPAMLSMTILYMISSAYGYYNMHFVKQGQTREIPENELKTLK